MNERESSSRRLRRWIAAAVLAGLTAVVAPLVVFAEREAANVRAIEQFEGVYVDRDCRDWVPERVRESLQDDRGPLAGLLLRPRIVLCDSPQLTASDAAALAVACDRAGVREIVAMGGRIDDITPFAEIAGLEAICFSGMSIDSAQLAAFARAFSLQHLDLSGTPTTDADLAPLAGLSNLSYLELGGTLVTDAVIPTLEAMPALTDVSLSGTGVSESALEALAGRKTGFEFSND